MSDSSFNANFYLAVAAAIPVLWITVGVATDVITRIIVGLRNSGLPFEVGIETPFFSYLMSPTQISLKTPFFSYLMSPTKMSLKIPGFTLHLSGQLYQAKRTAAIFLMLLVSSGATGEVLCAFALFFQSRNAIMAYVTLICLLMLILLTSFILIVSLFTAAAKALADQPNGARSAAASAESAQGDTAESEQGDTTDVPRLPALAQAGSAPAARNSEVQQQPSEILAESDELEESGNEQAETAAPPVDVSDGPRRPSPD